MLFKRIFQSAYLPCSFYRKSASRAGCTQSLKVWPLALCHYLNGIELALLLFGYAMAAAMTQKTARHVAVSTEQTPEAMVASSALLPRPGDR